MADLKLSIKLDADGKALVTVLRDAKGEATQLSGSLNTTGDAGKRAAAGLDTTAKSATTVNTHFASLYRNALALAGGLTAMSIIDRADDWGQYASRMKMATQSTAEYDYAQSRMVASANDTYRSLTETREGFIRMSPILRDMGYNLSQSIDIVDSYSSQLVINAASADRAQQAQDALVKSIQSGRIEADSWQSIFGVMPSVLDNLTAATGKTGAEIRQLGVSGKLSIVDLTNALLKSYEENRKAVQEMPTTVRDAMRALNNVYQDYIGKNNEATGATAALSTGIVSLSNHFGTLVNVAGVTLVAALSRSAGQLATNTIASIQDAIAKERARAATVSAAAAELELATVQRARVITAGQAVVAEARLVAARQAYTAATAEASIATRAFGGAMALVGGPAGLVIMGASALAYWAMTASDGKKKTADMADEVARLTGNIADYNRAQLDSKVRQLQTQYRAQLDALVAIDNKIAEMENSRNIGQGPSSRAAAMAWQQQLNALKAQRTQAEAELNAISGAQQKVFQQVTDQRNAAGWKGNIVDPGLTKSAQEMIDKLKQQNALYGNATEAAKVFYELEAGSLAGLDPLMAKKLQQAAADYDATKKTTDAEKKHAEELKKLLGNIDPVTQAAKEYGQQEKLLQQYFKDANTPLAERARLLANLKNQYEASLPYNKLRGQLDPAYAETQTNANNMDVLNQELAATPEDEVSKRAQINALIEAEQRRHADTMMEINTGVSINWNQMWQDSLDRMTSGIGSATADALFESKNFGDGVQQTIKGVAKSLVAMSVEWAARKAVMWALDKAFGTSGAATSIATAAATGPLIAAAYAPAAAMVSLATLGSNSAPAMAGITATTGLASTLSLAGIAHDGLPINRNEGTYLLRRDEMVLNPKQRENFEVLVDYANGGNAGGRSVVVQQTNQIYVQGDSQAQMVAQLLPQLVNLTKAAVIEDANSRGAVYDATR